MISRIIRHEWTVMRRAPVTWWATGLILAAVIYALVGGLAWQSERVDEIATIEDVGATHLAELRTAASADGIGSQVGSVRTWLPFPLGPVESFSVGLTDLLPKQAEISIWKRPDTLFGRYQLESPLTLLAGRFDLSFVVLYLLPLFLLALSYDLLASEREDGRLALLLIQPVALPRLFTAKLLARLLPLTAFLVIVVGGGAMAAGMPLAALPRVAGWLMVAWLYGVFWLAVCGLVAAYTRRPETAAAALAAIWLLVVLIIPGLLDVGVRTASPVPSRLEAVTAQRAASTEASRASAELLATYYHEHPELATNGQQGGFLPAYYASEREVERQIAPLLTDFDDRLTRQQALVSRWRFTSPAVVAQEALNELAGVGLDRHRDFSEQARAFLASWHAEMAPRIFLGQSLAAADFDRLPSFEFAEPPVSSGRMVGAVLGLLLPSVVALALTRRRLERFPVIR